MVPSAKIHPLVRAFVHLGVGSLLVALISLLLLSPVCTKGPTSSTRAWIHVLVTACDSYALDHGALPPGDADGGTRSLVGLLTASSSRKAWQPPYVDIIPEHLDGGSPPQLVDLWGGRLTYRIVKGRPEVRSAGPDGRFGTDDDLTSEP